MQTASQLIDGQRHALDNLAAELRARRPTVVFTGAGISTESGIPDFRGPNGLWKRTTPMTFQDFLDDPAVRQRYWARRRASYATLASVRPNDGHQAVSALQQAGIVSEVVTQNVDGLHQQAGSPTERVIELHGSAHRIRCLRCRTLFAADAEPFQDIRDGEEPSCPVCGGMVKDATIAVGEQLDATDLDRALTAARQAGVVLVVGSSLTVNPAAKVPLVGYRAGATLAIINNESTPLDSYAHYVIHAPAGVALRYLTERVLGATDQPGAIGG
mgnify:FL=1